MPSLENVLVPGLGTQEPARPVRLLLCQTDEGEAVIEDALRQRTLPDGRIVAIVPLTYGRARITIGRDEMTYEDGW